MTFTISRRSLFIGASSMAAFHLVGLNPAFAQSASQILEANDRLRNPQQPFRSNIKITDYIGGKVNEAMAITVFSKPRREDGQFRSIVHIDAPEKDAGKVMLRNGKDLYFYDPDAANTVRVSPQQRLMGQASNGDVMTTNFARDYSATLAGEETVEDARKQKRACYALKMRASNAGAVYKAVDYWIDKESMQPVKGRFYSGSGKLLKIAFYDGFRQALGATRATKVSIIDGMNSKRVSVMQFSNFADANLPDEWFQQSYLPKFRKP